MISDVNILIGSAANFFVSARLYLNHVCDAIPANLGYCFCCRNLSIA